MVNHSHKWNKLLFSLGALVFALSCAAQVKVNVKREIAVFTENKDSILSYQIAPKSLNGNYSRANYIHPLFGLDGTVLTEDFPDDHLHHRGIFWAWHQLYIGGKRIGDGWEIKDFTWEVASVSEIELAEGKAIESTVYWKSPLWVNEKGREKPFVKEITRIRVYPKKNQSRKIQIEINIYALEENMKIGGSEDAKGYGGFSARVHLPEDFTFEGPAGTVTPQNLPVESDGWINMTGKIGGQQKQGLAILAHTENPGYPNPWILRSKSSMQNAVYPFPGIIPVQLSVQSPLTLKYLLIVHDGTLDPSTIERYK